MILVMSRISLSPIEYFSHKGNFVSFFQIYFYQNVRCRTEMADKDLLMLQVSAFIWE